MLKGIGTDILEKNRIEVLFAKYGEKFLNKILGESEKRLLVLEDNYRKQVSFLSNNFSGKEAVSKTLGTGFSGGVRLKDIEVTRNDNGSPKIVLRGKAKKVAEEKGFTNFYITISDTDSLSMSFVIGEGK